MKSGVWDEVIRKSLNLVALIIPIGAMRFPKTLSLILITAATAIFFIHDLLRIFSKKARQKFYKTWGKMYRRWEFRSLSGATYLMLGSTMALFLYDTRIASLAITYAIVGDTFAAIVGKHRGKYVVYDEKVMEGRVRRRTLEGTIAFFVSAFLAGLAFPSIGIGYNLLGAVLAAILELTSVIIDDNFTIPVVVGFILQVLI